MQCPQPLIGRPPFCLYGRAWTTTPLRRVETCVVRNVREEPVRIMARWYGPRQDEDPRQRGQLRVRLKDVVAPGYHAQRTDDAVVAALAQAQPDLVVDVSDQHGEHDIVLIAGPLRAGLAAVLADVRGPRAQLACVLGGADVPRVAAGPMLDVLRHELRAVGVIVTTVEPDEEDAWLGALLADEGWWVEAVWSHTRATNRPPPFIAVDPAIHRAMSPWVLMREAASRAALRLEREGLDRMSARLAGRYNRAWLRDVIAVNRPDSEMGGPSEEGPREQLIGLQTALGGLGRPLRPRSWAEDQPSEPRYARFAITRTNGDAWRPVERFVAGGQHRVEVWIAGGEGGTPAEDPFPEPEQPDADGAVDLSVVLCLIEPRDGAVPASAVIRLPARGDSERAVFSLRPPVVPFVARVVVSHRQRVLQTLLLTQPTDGPPRLTVELRVHGSLGPSLAGREPFDAAIVLNPSTALAIGTGGAGLALLPEGSDAAVRGIQEILEREDIRGVELRGRDRTSARALHRLAMYGNELWDAVVNRPGMAEHLAHARRIQVVEAREGAYLPVTAGAGIWPKDSRCARVSASGSCPLLLVFDTRWCTPRAPPAARRRPSATATASS